MNTKNVDIRCDGGVTIGMGHVMRCIALANMLGDAFNIRFVIQQSTDNVKRSITAAGFAHVEIPRTNDFENECAYIHEHLRPDSLVILDGYNFQSNYQKAIKAAGHVLIAIDDLHAWKQHADIVINHGGSIEASSYETSDYTKLLLGYPYLLLRKEFNNLSRRKFIRSIEKVMLSFGASDEHNLTYRFATWLLEHKPSLELDLMVSGINPHLTQITKLAELSPRVALHCDISADRVIQLMQESQLLICPASTISLEGSAVGISIITGTTAANQNDNCNSITKSGAALSLGDLTRCSKEEFLRAFDYLCNDADEINKQLAAQATIIDGKSANRILSEIKLIV